MNEIYNNYVHLETKLPFGKYKGCTIGEVLEKDFDYLLWLCDNTDYFEKNRADSEVSYKIARMKGEKNGSN